MKTITLLDSTREKSAALICALKWQLTYGPPCKDHEGNYISAHLISWTVNSETRESWCDIYKPVNMALAKLALEWGVRNNDAFSQFMMDYAYNMWYESDGIISGLDSLLEYLIEDDVI